MGRHQMQGWLLSPLLTHSVPLFSILFMNSSRNFPLLRQKLPPHGEGLQRRARNDHLALPAPFSLSYSALPQFDWSAEGKFLSLIFSKKGNKSHIHSQGGQGGGIEHYINKLMKYITFWDFFLFFIQHHSLEIHPRSVYLQFPFIAKQYHIIGDVPVCLTIYLVKNTWEEQFGALLQNSM